MRLDLGCGTRKIDPSWTGVDVRPFAGVDVVADLCKRWPWDDNTIDEVHCSHMVEHLDAKERIHFVNELFRVLKPGAQARIIAPDWSSTRAYGDLTHCFAEDTELLTENGWKPIRAASVGERALVMNLDSEKASYSSILNIIDEPYDGPMLHFKTDCLDLLVTPIHDLVWRAKGGNGGYWERRGKIAPRPRLRKSMAKTFITMGGHHPRRGTAVVNWTGDEPKRIRIAPDERSNGRTLPGEFDALAFVELIGWYVAEGHVDLSSQGHYRISIAQSLSANPEKVAMICDVIRRLGCKPHIHHDRVRFDSKPLALFLHPLGLAPEKSLPPIVKGLSPKLLRALLKMAVLGDGSKNGPGRVYASTSSRLADDIQEVALKAGYRTSLYTESRKGIVASIGEGKPFVAKYDIHRVGITNPKDLWYPIPSAIQYKGRQVCVFVAEHHNIMVRRNGYPVWAGNCWPPVSAFWFNYLNAEWRRTQAPHNDGYTCDFDITPPGFGIREDIVGRNQEYVMYALTNYKDAAQDVVATITKPAERTPYVAPLIATPTAVTSNDGVTGPSIQALPGWQLPPR